MLHMGKVLGRLHRDAKRSYPKKTPCMASRAGGDVELACPWLMSKDHQVTVSGGDILRSCQYALIETFRVMATEFVKPVGHAARLI